MEISDENVHSGTLESYNVPPQLEINDKIETPVAGGFIVYI